MRTIAITNQKGGSGKTTLATNLSAYYASRGLATTLIDFDPQASSTRWLKSRPAGIAPIHGIPAFERNTRVTRSFQLRLPQGTARVVVDTPAAIDPVRFTEYTHNADAVLIPVLPSQIDIHACARAVQHLLTTAKIKRRENRIGVVANRVRFNTVVFRSLMRFLESLEIPIVATLRDSQNYIRAFDTGVGLHEMRAAQSMLDVEQWAPLVDWIESRGTAEEAAAAEVTTA